MKVLLNFIASKMRILTAFSSKKLIFPPNSYGNHQGFVLYFIRITVSLVLNSLANMVFLW